ncbi:hypothetical protein [uncultured Eubacterium sp.]|uniref:hypothetical protein n=2 Tax=Eubacterium TaxID=1730 RepID=UPI00265D1048|nr:hypothetical protein [uncultured Eubacterium sp.]
MKKGFKKIMAYFCAIALIVTSVTVYNNKSVSAYEDSEYTALTNGKGAAVGDWSELFAGTYDGLAGNMSYAGSKLDDLSLKIDESCGKPGTWHLQAKTKLTGLTAGKTYDIKTKLNSSMAGILYEKTDVTGVVNSNIEIKVGENETTLQFKATGETETLVFELSGMPTGCVIDFKGITTTEATEIVTTTEQQPEEDGYYASIKGQWTLTSPWSAFSTGSIKYKGTADSNSATVDIKFAEYGGGDWQTQLRVLGSTNTVGPLEAGKDYKVKVDYTASKAFDGLVKVGEKAENVKFAEGTNSLEISYKAETEKPDIYLNLGYAPADEELNIKLTLVKVEDIQTSVDPTSNNVTSADASTPDASTPDVSTPDVSTPDVSTPDVSIPDVSTPDASTPDASTPDETTTPKPTTAKPTVKPTTAKPTTKKASLKKTKITKKITKKLSSKKVKLTFKKVKGAKKYTVQVSTSKKFKKVLYKKTVKKTKVTLSSKKFKGKKKLYVRVKAVGAKKWSKVVKIKVKK